MTVPVAAPAAVRRSPYQGLVPFTEADADWFFGRDEWAAVIADNLRAYRITVLYGPSGVGKSSVLRAGLMRQLRDEARENAADVGVPRLLPVIFSAWSLDEPLTALERAVAAAGTEFVAGADGPVPGGSLASLLDRLPAQAGGPLLLVLDQLEELFLYHEGSGDATLEELSAVLRRREPSVHLLLSLREDALARLDRFEGRVPGLLDHLLGLAHLDREAAREAILAPLEHWNAVAAERGEEVSAEPALVEAVLEQVQTGKVSVGERGAGAADAREDAASVEAPYLQLVLMRLWDEERRIGSRELRVQTLHRLGGAERIVRTHLDSALAALSPREQRVAGRTFRYLVTPSGTKVAYRLGDLAEYAEVSEADLEPLVAELAGDVRVLRPAGDGRYEIYHDALAGPILDWNGRWHERMKRRRDWLRIGVLAALVVALAVIAVVIARLVGDARDAEEAARLQGSKALAEQAFAALATSPRDALQLALEAADGDFIPEAEDALRAAIEGASVHHVLGEGADATDGLVLSGDGARLVTYGTSGATVWDVRAGRALSTLPTNGQRVYQAAFSADGERVMTVGDDGLGVWEAANGRRIDDGVGRRARRRAQGLSSDGRTVVVGEPGRLALLRVPTGRTVGTLPMSRRVDQGSVLSPGGDRLITGGTDGTVRLWKVGSGRRLEELLVQRRAVRRLQAAIFDAGGDRVLLAYRGRMVLVDARTGQVRHTVRTRDRVTSAVMSSDGRRVLTLGEKRTRVWDATTGRSIATVRGLEQFTNARFSLDGSFVAAAGANGRVRIWDAATGALLSVLRSGEAAAEHVVFAPDGRSVFTATEDGTVAVWDVAASIRGQLVLGGHRETVHQATFDPAGARVATASADGTVRIWSAATGRTLHSLRAHPIGAFGAALGPDHRLLTAGLFALRMWDSATAEVLWTFGSTDVNAPFDYSSPEINADATLVVAVSSKGAIVFTANGKRLRTFTSRKSFPRSATFSPDGRSVLVAGGDGTLTIWDPRARGGPRRTLRTGTALRSAAYNRDGTRVVIAGEDGTAQIWDLRRPRAPVHTLRGHGGRGINSAAFSPDDRFVVTAGDDETVRVWNAATERLLITLRGHAGPAESAEFSPDGNSILSAGADGLARLWPCDTCRLGFGALRERARERLAQMR